MSLMLDGYVIPKMAFGVRPAAMGTCCEALYTNPEYTPDNDLVPLVIRCKAEATVRVKVNDGGRVSVTKQCPACLDVLRQKRGVVVLSEERL